MLVLAVCLLALLSPALRRGDLRRLAAVRLRAVWLPLVALALQVVIIEVVPRAPRLLESGIHLATYVMAGAFIVVNRKVPGLLVIAAGALLNAVTIALNGGTLPASAAALHAAGIAQDGSQFLNSGVLTHPVLPWLGDVFAWPAPLPLHNVFSIGDLLIVVGAGYGAHRICRREPEQGAHEAQTQRSPAAA